MDLESLQIVYYSMAIVFMTLIFLAAITIIILGIYIKIKLSKIERAIETTVEEFQRNPSEKAAEVALNIGAGIASAGAKKYREYRDKNKKK